MACKLKRWDIAKLLLEQAKADPNIFPPFKEPDHPYGELRYNNPFHLVCAASNPLEVELMKLMLERSNSKENGCADANTMFPYNPKRDNHNAQQKLRILHLLALNRSRLGNKTSAEGIVTATKLLLEHGADANAENGAGETPLHIGCSYCSTPLEFIRLLLDNGAHINAQNTVCKSTPLHRAIGKNMEPIIRLLLQKGADTTLTDSKGDTPEQLAIAKGYVYISNLLLRHNDPQGDKSSKGNSRCSSAIAEGSANKYTDDLRKTVSSLFGACRMGRTQMLSVILKKLEGMAEFDINVGQKDFDGLTQLHEASMNGRLDAVKLLLAPKKDGGCNCNPNVEDPEGDTPLSLATYNGHIDVMRALLQKGATTTSLTSKKKGMPGCTSSAGPAKKKAKNEDKAALATATEYDSTWTLPDVHKLFGQKQYSDVEKRVFLMIAAYCDESIRQTVFHKASLKLRRDKKFMTLALQFDANLIARAPKTIQQDDDIMIDALAHAPVAFKSRYQNEQKFQEDVFQYLVKLWKGLLSQIDDDDNLEDRSSKKKQVRKTTKEKSPTTAKTSTKRKRGKKEEEKLQKVKLAVEFVSGVLEIEDEQAPSHKEDHLKWRDNRIYARDIRANKRDETYKK